MDSKKKNTYGNSGLIAALDRRLGANIFEFDISVESLLDDFLHMIVNETNRFASAELDISAGYQ